MGSRPSARTPAVLPTLDQRLRILQLVSSLSPHHTKECLRHSQPIFVDQALKRYEPLYGQKGSWRNGAGFFGWGGSKKKAAASTGGDYDFDGTAGDLDSHAGLVKRDLSGQKHKYFFAINLYNSFDVIPDLFATLFRVAAILGYHNVYVSIYENGSTDQTKALLKIFDAIAGTAGLRVEIRTSMRTRGAFNHRIEYLAEVRNAALVPLHELRESKQEIFDSIVFMNDILPCVDDLLELIWQSRRQNAGITCASDYMFHEDIVRFSILLLLAGQRLTPLVLPPATPRDHPSSTTTGWPETSMELPSRTRPLSRSSTTPSRPVASRTTFLSKSSRAGTESPSSTLRPSTPSPTQGSGWPTSPPRSAVRVSVRSFATTTPRPVMDESSWFLGSSSRTTTYVLFSVTSPDANFITDDRSYHLAPR